MTVGVVNCVDMDPSVIMTAIVTIVAAMTMNMALIIAMTMTTAMATRVTMVVTVMYDLIVCW